jgi:hypothetical protein
MPSNNRVERALAAGVLAFAMTCSGSALAQAAAAAGQEYSPSVGQEGKDVIWVPTPQSLVERMLQMAKTTPNDYVVDLGSGDGRTVITAAKKYGARALGIEYNPDMVELSKRNAQKEGVADKAQFMRADIFQTDFSKATVLTLYLLPSLNLKLRPTILDMKPGTRVVSHAFTMDDWAPDQVESSEGRTAYMWIVPAKVSGTWRVEVPGGASYETTFIQQFQNVGGSAKVSNKPVQFSNGKLNGETITFSIADENNVRREFTGRVNGNRIDGNVRVVGENTPAAKFVATRSGDPR